MAVTINASTSAGLVQTADTSGVLQLQTNSGTTALTIDTSQRVGIGTTSPSTKLNLNATTAPTIITEVTSNAVGDKVGELKFYSRGVANNWGAGIASFVPAGAPGIDNLDLRFYTSTGATLNTERMRIDNSGNVLVGTTAQQTGASGKLSIAGGTDGIAGVFTNNSNGSAYTIQVFNYTTATGGGTGRYVKFAMGSTPTQTGSIVGDGTNTAFNTSSDYRLKENVEPMAGALALVMQQRPVTWVWKSNGKLGKGFIAHWLQEDGAGECVSGEKDAVDADGNPDYQGVDTSFLVATLTAAIQEQQTIINDLKARITALEGAA
jgi:hypothetical protein